VQDAVRAAGRHAAGGAQRVALDLPGPRTEARAERCIYLAYARDNRLHYIGKVDRAAGTTAAGRLAEHLRSSPRKRSAWRSVWVVALTPDMPASELLALERALIQAHRPPGNIQHAHAAGGVAW
jgi:hypothetical protein